MYRNGRGKRVELPRVGLFCGESTAASIRGPKREMLKRPKYKKGYTWSHYFDEWWDRVGQEFKIKLVVSILLLLVLGTGFGLACWFQRYEKKELMEFARIRLEQERETIRSKLNQRPIPRGNWSPRED